MNTDHSKTFQPAGRELTIEDSPETAAKIRKPRTRHQHVAPDNHQALEAKEAAIRASGAALRAAQIEVALAHARTAALWISINRPDVAMGAEPEFLLVADDDDFTLAELEDYGHAGNAVQLHSGPFGELWWCDPEGRKPFRHECLLFAAKTTGATQARTVVLRFNRPATV